LCERFHREGAAAVAVLDRNRAGAQAVADRVGGLALPCDVTDETALAAAVTTIEERAGPITLFCSNAGVADFGGDPDNAASPPNDSWQRGWEVHVMAHVYAARALLPRMIGRGGGYFLHTISAAGLLSQIGNPVYSTTKHAAVGFAEHLAITHRDQGIRVSILCPQGVDTPLLRGGSHGPQHLDGVLTPEQVADATIQGLDAERFLILPHPQVASYIGNKAENHDRWIGGMAKLRRSLAAAE
jgi:NAD(P)-dependent dehydrogenase (short-subunit alcohol dehydrogenase family)